MAVALTYSKEPLNSTEIELEVDGPDQEVSDAMGLESVSPDMDKPRSRSLSISNVAYQLERDGMASPIVRAFARSAMNRWRGNVEKKITKRLMEVKAERKKRDADAKEIAQLVARTIPIDILARDWLNDNDITSEIGRASCRERV